MPNTLKGAIGSKELQHLDFIHQTLFRNGHECYLVGGCCRDFLLNKPPKEFDLATSAKPEQVRELFPVVIETGIKHGTVTVVLEKISYEITTFRKDIGYSDGRRPDNVSFGTTLEEDLTRRDFTINAIAFDWKTEQFLDNHQGFADIQAKTIRCLGNPLDRFQEDGLRPIRALRFASVLGFKLEQHTEIAIGESLSVVAKISRERLWEEMQKAFQGPKPSEFARGLGRFGILSLFLSPWESNRLAEPYLVFLDSVPKDNPSLALYSLLKSFGGKVQESWASQLRVSNETRAKLNFYQNWEDENLGGEEYENEGHWIRSKVLSPLASFAEAKNWDRETFFWENQPFMDFLAFQKQPFPEFKRVLEFWNQKPALTIRDLAIKGETLKAHFPNLPGPQLGNLLKELLRIVLKYPKSNTEKILLEQCAVFLSNSFFGRNPS